MGRYSAQPQDSLLACLSLPQWQHWWTKCWAFILLRCVAGPVLSHLQRFCAAVLMLACLAS